jgi:hypothetical protein
MEVELDLKRMEIPAEWWARSHTGFLITPSREAGNLSYKAEVFSMAFPYTGNADAST